MASHCEEGSAEMQIDRHTFLRLLLCDDACRNSHSNVLLPVLIKMVRDNGTAVFAGTSNFAVLIASKGKHWHDSQSNAAL